MSTPSVLLIEHASGSIQHTRLPWEDLTVRSTPRAGAAVALKTRPAVILISLRQTERNGMQLARALRKRLGDAPIIIVYGKPTAAQRRVLLEQRAQIRSKWGVDRVLASEPSGSRLAELVERLQETRQRQAGTVAIPAAPTPTEAPQPPAAPPKAAPMTVVSRQELRQAVRDATASVSGRQPKAPASAVSRFFSSLRDLFRRPAA